MNHIERFASAKKITFTSVIVCCVWVCPCYAEKNNSGLTARPYLYDSNAISKAKDVLAFDAYEKKAPRYRSAITNWNPVFPECDGITNIMVHSKSGSDYATTRDYLGLDKEKGRWIRVSVDCFKSSHDAHEYLMKKRSNPATEISQIETVIKKGEVTDVKQLIGFRCFKSSQRDIGDEIVFIRNNLCISIFGRGVKVETLARDLDRQIVELSGKAHDNK